MVNSRPAANLGPAADPPVAPEPPPLAPDHKDRVAFHMAEFSALKSEIAELVKVASSTLQYALALSGAITTWLVSSKAPTADNKLLFSTAQEYFDWEYLNYIFFLPLMLSLVFGMLALAAYRRIEEKGSYLRAIENQLRAERLGWERRFEKRPRTLGGLYGAAWLGLIVFNVIVALVGSGVLRG